MTESETLAVQTAEKAFGLAKTIGVYALTIEDKHVTSTTMWRNHAEMMQHLYDWIEDNWHYDEPCPDDLMEAIEQYFDGSSENTWHEAWGEIEIFPTDLITGASV